jgi:hypothetical protein
MTTTAESLPEPVLEGRLDFALPEFCRISWVSDAARAVWEPRVERIRFAWSRVEWHAVARGVRRCALTRTAPEELPRLAHELAGHGLVALPIGLEGSADTSYATTPAPYRAGSSFVYPLVIGRSNDAFTFARHWEASDHEGIGALLGYPSCCRDFFAKVWVERRMVDTTWPMACATPGARRTALRTLVIEGASLASPMLRWLGVRLVPHLPCTHHCAASVAFAMELANVGRFAGFGQEMDWAEEMLRWSVEWDANHGIAELRLPVARIVARSDATAARHVVRVLGDGTAPAEAAHGLRFPYRAPAKRPQSERLAFQRGLRNSLQGDAPLPLDTEFRDNGFSSYRAMQLAHGPLIAVTRAALEGRGVADVIDLGAGNGRLVHAICAGTALRPAGVDLDPERIERAKARGDAAQAERFVVADLFEMRRWPALSGPLAAALLMVGRLSEGDAAMPGAATRLLTHLRAYAERVVVYRYGAAAVELQELLHRYGLSDDVDRLVEDSAVAIAVLRWRDVRSSPPELHPTP